MAGLRCALLLEEKGIDVTVLEARMAPGGRLRTLADLPGRPEAGGQTLARSYARMRAMSERVGARLEAAMMGHGPKAGNCADCHRQGATPDHRGGPGSLVHFEGRLIRDGDWAEAVPGLSERERKVSPDRLLATYLAAQNPLQDGEAWTRPEHAPLDRISIEEYARRQGATPVALRAMDVAPNCPGIAKASALWGLRDAQRRAAAVGGVPLEFPTGSAAFVEKLAGALRAKVRTGRVVTELATTGEGLRVRCADGSTHEADFGICTLPLPALARLRFDPPLEAEQAAGIREIRYTPITRVYFEVSSPFWEKDELPVSMWTDSPLERIFPLREPGGAVVGFVSHVDGPNAETLDAMDDEKRHRFAEAELARIRPASRGAVTAVATTSWAKDPFAGGAYPYWAPGQITRFRSAITRPWGRLHFAGEHSGLTQPGMEAAAESADRAVAELLARIG